MPSASRAVPVMSLALWLSAPAAYASPETIEVFTTADRPVRIDDRPDVVTYRVDGLRELETSLGQDLPSDPAKAKAMALERLGAMKVELQDAVERSVGGLSLAQSYGLRKLPAIVFDRGQSVVYGVDELAEALSFYRDSR